MRPHADQCKNCRFETGHPWPPCSNDFWKKLKPVQKDALLSGTLRCLGREERECR